MFVWNTQASSDNKIIGRECIKTMSKCGNDGILEDERKKSPDGGRKRGEEAKKYVATIKNIAAKDRKH